MVKYNVPGQLAQLFFQPTPFIWASIMGVVVGIIFVNYNKSLKKNEAFGMGLILGFLIFYFVVSHQNEWLVKERWPFVVGTSLFIGFCSPYIKDKGQHADKLGAILVGFTITMFVCFLVLDKIL